MQASTATVEKTYPISGKNRFWLWGMAAAILSLPTLMFIGGAVSGNEALLGTGFLLGLIMAPFAAFLWFCGWYPRLTVTAEGLKIRGAIGFSTVLIPWNNIERVRVHPGSEGLVLREPLELRAAKKWSNYAGMRYAGGSFYDAEQQVLIAERRYIPIQGYAYWLEHGDLLQAMQPYAPWIVEFYTQQQPAIAAERKQNRKVLWFVLGISGVLSAGAMLAGAFWSDVPAEWKDVLGRMDSVFSIAAGWAIGIALVVYALVNLRSAWRLLKDKQFGSAAMWTAMAIVQVLIVMALAGSQM